ncbi:hypothetical protein DFH09DRAFT_1319418 [Mycena vulgaris]|nr:hypothetical protein DFH09DRAFT_1319418 [Mycena vulgaris]
MPPPPLSGHVLNSALASKQYACSHLLALLFADEDNEGYWEDVMVLLVDAEQREDEFDKPEPVRDSARMTASDFHPQG